jgi:hypothetical protein
LSEADNKPASEAGGASDAESVDGYRREGCLVELIALGLFALLSFGFSSLATDLMEMLAGLLRSLTGNPSGG